MGRGRTPHGRDEQHWQKAAQLVEAEAQPDAENETGEPQWLLRESAISTGEPGSDEKPMTLEQLARRIASVKAA